MRDNGLIYAEAPESPYMDGCDRGWHACDPATVCGEINALWYNAVVFTIELAKNWG